jgi:hypothetical protein
MQMQRLYSIAIWPVYGVFCPLKKGSRLRYPTSTIRTSEQQDDVYCESNTSLTVDAVAVSHQIMSLPAVIRGYVSHARHSFQSLSFREILNVHNAPKSNQSPSTPSALSKQRPLQSWNHLTRPPNTPALW